VDVFEVAEDFEGGDADRLKALCEKAGKTKRNEIEELASVLWAKKVAEKKDEEPEVKPDSGVTKGASNPTKAQIREAFVADPNNMEKMRAYEDSLRT